MRFSNRLRKLEGVAGPRCPGCGGPLAEAKGASLDLDRLDLAEAFRLRDILRRVHVPAERDDEQAAISTCPWCDRDAGGESRWELLDDAERVELVCLVRKLKGEA